MDINGSPLAAEGNIRLAFSKPTRTVEEQSLLFNSYGSCGYEGLQLKNNQYAPYLDEPERFKEQWGHLKGVGSALIAFGSLQEKDQVNLRRMIQFGKVLGTEIIVFCPADPRQEKNRKEDIAKVASVLSGLGMEAREEGIQISLHHHYNSPVMHREDFDIFFDHIEDQSIGLTVDTAHLVKSGIMDIAELVRSFRQVINNFHLKDYSNGEWRVLGQGDISFDPVFQAIHEIGFKGWVSADEESGGGITEGLGECFSYINSRMIKLHP
ncbi:sugar phosphate isomerase/epimerase [Paenibacillus sp. S3N08]|uniref:Sugar phosphate isomerase/epimerase n=2 Tax=Paenibacillus agricola TaxID=2716264 RepID=A0ABX0JD52_9BACL|nr:sugar phosphate isomerase/epimerase [Paenibacillus agricola]